MGLFDSVVGGLVGKFMGDSPLAQAAMNLYTEHGGLDGLLSKFQESGLSEQVASWVGTGSNLPISAEQVQDVLGGNAIAGLAAKVGLSPDELKNKLAEYLPMVVDKLTPEGKLGEVTPAALGQVLEMLKK